MSKADVKSLLRGFEGLALLPDRRPESRETEASFCMLSAYRDGGIFLAHYAGNSEWERHPRGDEIVYVVDGTATLFLLSDGEELPHRLRAGELLVVPRNTWHRFEAPAAVKVMSVTPRPTDHSIERPS